MIPQMIFNDNDFQDDFLLHSLVEDFNSSDGALTTISDESLPDLLMDDNRSFEGFSEEPTPYDVLCGQSRACANHSGNKRFQATLDMYASKYDAAKSKQEKMTLTKEIVGCIAANGGRFLKFKNNKWVEIANVTARDKVSHALRTKVQSWKRQQGSSSSKKAPSIRKRRHIRRSTPSASTPSLTECKAVSFDGSTSSAASVMDELLRTQRDIFEKLTQADEMHPLK
ncbi:unnamed protein product [Cylindrotheca closterium]|uniref:DUF6824 domain-containing protein n=1 Tax=Cylindrotheca closterium TaxID=2856 RepID=A0AAD2CLN8_9STRA|nr:unnamed protein product [Cylindrotheca closterium]CAJ1922593.1 unnamed protein product [Cylindrotheca closterium]